MLTFDAEGLDSGIQSVFSGSELPDSGTSSRSGRRSWESEEKPSMAMQVDEFSGDKTSNAMEMTVHAGEPAAAQSLEKGHKLSAPSRKRLTPLGLAIRSYVQIIRNIPGMTKYYEIEGKSLASCRVRIVKIDPNGYRFHPFTVHLLAKYYSALSSVNQVNAPGLSGVNLRERFPAIWVLVALLVQDSTTPNVAREIWHILANCFVGPSATLNDNLVDMINALAEYVNYGIEHDQHDATEPPSARCDLHIWELRDPSSLLPSSIAETIIERQHHRRMYSQVLRGAVGPAEGRADPEANSVAVPSSNISAEIPESAPALMEITATPTLKKNSASTSISKKQAAHSLLTKGIAKISSFFNVIRKEPELMRDASMLFQPFFPKASMTVAPANFFPQSLSTIKQFTHDLHTSVRFKRKFAIKQRSKYCKCIGYDSTPVLSIAKLLQFHDNYRPAYFGTLSSPKELDRSRLIRARNPFARVLVDADYEYDSDDDWGDDADIEDAESISDSDNNSEEESMPSEITDEDDLSWLVPDGCVTEGDLPTTDRAEIPKGTTSLAVESSGITWMSRSCNPHEPKRRHIEKTPIIVGPLRDTGLPLDDMAPPEITSIIFTWAKPTADAMPIDPLEGVSVTEVIGAYAIPQSAISITGDMLRILAGLVNGSRQGVEKLLNLFTARLGGAKVSRRHFELKLNQIASKQQPQPDSKPVWVIRPEFAYLMEHQLGDSVGPHQDAEDPQPVHHQTLYPNLAS